MPDRIPFICWISRRLASLRKGKCTASFQYYIPLPTYCWDLLVIASLGRHKQVRLIVTKYHSTSKRWWGPPWNHSFQFEEFEILWPEPLEFSHSLNKRILFPISLSSKTASKPVSENITFPLSELRDQLTFPASFDLNQCTQCPSNCPKFSMRAL